jgi:hypothetical protein
MVAKVWTLWQLSKDFLSGLLSFLDFHPKVFTSQGLEIGGCKKMEDSIDEAWSSYAQSLKAQLWGNSSPEADEFHQAKYWGCAADGAIPGWSNAKWLAERWSGIPKTSTRGCHTVTHPRGGE